MTTLRAMYSKIRSLSLEQLAVNAVATVMAICWVYQRRRQRKKEITGFGTTVGSSTFGLPTSASATRAVSLLLRFNF